MRWFHRGRFGRSLGRAARRATKATRKLRPQEALGPERRVVVESWACRTCSGGGADAAKAEVPCGPGSALEARLERVHLMGSDLPKEHPPEDNERSRVFRLVSRGGCAEAVRPTGWLQTRLRHHIGRHTLNAGPHLVPKALFCSHNNDRLSQGAVRQPTKAAPMGKRVTRSCPRERTPYWAGFLSLHIDPCVGMAASQGDHRPHVCKR
ncbi:hypothetical protein BC834DRAFT_34733 [Gloeopeniophorella convolvens]|nr:hypothetical protein BC834DRAFT_34733 [Gloeopeniophorella convolvens]